MFIMRQAESGDPGREMIDFTKCKRIHSGTNITLAKHFLSTTKCRISSHCVHNWSRREIYNLSMKTISFKRSKFEHSAPSSIQISDTLTSRLGAFLSADRELLLLPALPMQF